MLEPIVVALLCATAFFCGCTLAWTLQGKKHASALRSVNANMTARVQERLESFTHLESKIKTLLAALNNMEGAFAKQAGIQTRFLKRLAAGPEAGVAGAPTAVDINDDLFILEMDADESSDPSSVNSARAAADPSAAGGALEEVIADWEKRCKDLQNNQIAELQRLRELIKQQSARIRHLESGEPTSSGSVSQDLHPDDGSIEGASLLANETPVDGQAQGEPPPSVDSTLAIAALCPDVDLPSACKRSRRTDDGATAVMPGNVPSRPETSESSASMSDESQPIHTQVARSLQEYAASEREYSRTFERLAQLSQQREQKLAALEQRVEEQAVVEERLQTSLTESRNLRSRCAELEVNVRTGQRSLDDLRAELDKVRAARRAEEDSALKWQEESEQAMAELRRDIEEKSQACQSLERALETRGREIEELRSLWEGLRQQREELDRRFVELQADHGERVRRIEDLQSQVSALEAELGSTRDNLGQKSSQLSQLMQSLELTQADMEQQRKAAAAKESHLQSAASVLGRLRPLIEALEGELTAEEKNLS
jgi:DNA repair exonuclease SbcCD ATPase subunit